NIAVRVLEREPTQTVMGIREWLPELDIARGILGRECVWVWNIEIRVPSCDSLLDVSRVVRHWRYTNGLEQDLRAAPTNNAEEDGAWRWSLERDLEPQGVGGE